MDELTVAPVTVNVAKVEPCGTVTEAGIVTAAPDLESVIVAPPEGAAAVSCTVPVADWPLVMMLGETETLLRAAGIGFTVTPALSVTPA